MLFLLVQRQMSSFLQANYEDRIKVHVTPATTPGPTIFAEGCRLFAALSIAEDRGITYPAPRIFVHQPKLHRDPMLGEIDIRIALVFGDFGAYPSREVDPVKFDG